MAYKHLTPDERLKIELFLKRKMPIKEIAYKLDKHISTIYREIKRATYKHTVTVGAKKVQKTQYAPEIAHEKYRKNLKEKGQIPKVLKDTLCKIVK